MSNLNYISSRLSLREPQRKSLKILADLVEEEIILSDLDLESALNRVKAKFPIFKDFERDFINICFSLATGVGKTRLMGAFISYLFKEKNINNFFVLAPNLTIYEKLKADFTTISSPKYVFRGIDSFAVKAPVIITGDDYEFKSAQLSNRQKDTVLINIFNIGKLNSEIKGDKNSSKPRIKRLSEVLGKSYFEFLQGLENLVIIMDEAHRYRADRGVAVINELKPILGLELTATPIIEAKSKSAEKRFQNIIYEYSLANAIRDGFVKEPAVATRKNFDPTNLSEEELERIKLEDAIQIHRKTQEHLKAYCYEKSVPLVKPFILVACKDTEHANNILNYVRSDEFFTGYFKQRAIEIHTKVTDDEFFKELSKIERPENTVEIVIHVNKLREGWDVNNLYTIVPLRASVSQTLTEQTIGRGLRLPFGKRTYEPILDRLTIIAHDNYEKLITEANKPDSLINKKNFIEIDLDELKEESFYTPSLSRLEEKYFLNTKEADKLSKDEKEKYIAEKTCLKIISEVIEENKDTESLFNTNIYKTKQSSIGELINKTASELGLNAESKEKSIKLVQEKFSNFQEFSKTVNIVNNNRDEDRKFFIKIPRIIRQAVSEDLDFSIKDFELNLMPFLRFTLIDQNILIQALREEESTLIYKQEIEKVNLICDDKVLKREIISHLINYPVIDYDSQSETLYKLLDQLFDYLLKQYPKQKDITNIVLYYKKEIAEKLYEQIENNLISSESTIETSFNGTYHSELKKPNGINAKEIKNYLESIESTTNETFKKISFNGFKKSYFLNYGFSSKPELLFARILEHDDSVKKWLRPHKEQFELYYKNSNGIEQRYEADFVVETDTNKFIIEIKRSDQIDNFDVQAKKQSAIDFCNIVNDFNKNNEWAYLLIPHDEIKSNYTFEYFLKGFKAEK